jgi:hypothetical protein
MRLVRIIVGWLLAPRQLLSLAGLCVAAGLLWGYATLQENADRTLALRQGPPAAVAIETYRGAIDRGPASEVVLRAVARPSEPIVLTMPGTGERALAVPLFPLAGGDGALGAILLPFPEGAEPPQPGSLAVAEADGTVLVNGRVVDGGDFALILAGALAVEGRFVGERFVAVQPYVEGREAALQPVADPTMAWLWPIGIALLLAMLATYRGVLTGVRFGLRRRPPVAARRPSAAAVASAHFAPLPRQEEVNDLEQSAGRSGAAAFATALAAAAAAIRLLARGTRAVLRLVWAGVEEIRSPR